MSERTPINQIERGHTRQSFTAPNPNPKKGATMFNYTDTSVPDRFRQVHESEGSLYLANEYRSQHVEAEEIILPHKSLDPVYSLRINLEEGTIEELIDALEEALMWTHKAEAHLPISAEATK